MKILDKFPDKQRRAKKVRTPDFISPEDLQKGCRAFQQRERRDAMYKTATFLVKHFWGKATEVAEGLGVLLCVWNNAFRGSRRSGRPAGDLGDPWPRRARRQAEPECHGGAAPGRRVADEVGPVA
jgi:hypothetical protein